jgi:hypothetical protein
MGKVKSAHMQYRCEVCGKRAQGKDTSWMLCMDKKGPSNYQYVFGCHDCLEHVNENAEFTYGPTNMIDGSSLKTFKWNHSKK